MSSASPCDVSHFLNLPDQIQGIVKSLFHNPKADGKNQSVEEVSIPNSQGDVQSTPWFVLSFPWLKCCLVRGPGGELSGEGRQLTGDSRPQ